MARDWRLLRAYGLDVLIVVAAVQGAVGTLLRHDADRPDGVLLWLDVVLVTALVLVLLLRRRFPFGAPVLTWVGGAVVSLLDRQAITSQPGIYVAGIIAALLLGSLRRGVLARSGLVIVLACAALVVWRDPTHQTADVLLTPLLFAISWSFGFALRERVEQAEAAEQRAERAEREREVTALMAVADERARMTRELHDVVAHAMSVMVLQVGAVRRRLPDSEEQEALGDVERTGRTALAEMRRLLGAFGSDEVELAPQPGLGDLETLARQVTAAGLDVRLHTLGQPVDLPRALDLSAYRIVQEGLTNALKHAAAHSADVTVDYAPDEVRLEIRDDGRGAARSEDQLGRGLIGIRERVTLYGGDMSAFASTSGGFVLRARLPLGRES